MGEMSLDKLCKELRERTAAEAKRIETDALAQANAIKSEARRQASEKISFLKKQADEEAAKKRVETFTARIQAKKIVSDAREALVTDALNELRAELAEVSKSHDYEKIFEKLVREGVRALGSQEFVLHVNKRDVALVKEMGLADRLSKDFLNDAGGVIVASRDGRIRINNSFQALVEEHVEELRQKAFEELFPREAREAKAQTKTKTKAKTTAGTGKLKAGSAKVLGVRRKARK